MPNVTARHPQFKAVIERYQMIADCLEGEEAIKAAGDKYLPRPNAADKSAQNRARYEAYITRAQFFNVVKNTASGLIGEAMAVEPVIEVPDIMDALKKDATGLGVSLSQLGRAALAYVLPYGRCGILADFPRSDRVFTRAEIISGDARPTITAIDPRRVINWRTESVGGARRLVLVVIVEQYETADDGFEVETAEQIRALRLLPDGVQIEIYRETERGIWVLHELIEPTDSRGARLQEIMFSFAGATDNDPEPDDPPMHSMATLNIAHYRNSADYEDSVYMVGQPTPWFSGLTKQWVEDVLKGQIELGSRGGVLLPEGGTAGLLQAEPNPLVAEAMRTKEKQMIAIGAQLVEDREVQRTLGEAQMHKATVTSTLASCAKNVSAALEQALKWCAAFYGTDPGGIQYKISTDFAIMRMSSDERRVMIEEYQQGLLTYTEVRDQLRRSGIASLDDDDARGISGVDLDETEL